MTTPTGIAFEKWEGLGNDFVIIELPPGVSQPFDPERTRELCDRHRGLGADGILFIDRSGPHPRMIVSNADGSRPEMCGNGLRCVAAFLAMRSGLEGRLSANRSAFAPHPLAPSLPRKTPRRGGKDARSLPDLPSPTSLRSVGDPLPLLSDVTLLIATDAGEKRCIVERSPSHYAVTVDMGIARQTGPLEIAISSKMHTFTTIDMGNPHAITFDPVYTQSDIDHIAPTIATSVPGGINVEFCRIVDDGIRPRIDVTVWERGVGRTLACGTGACAVAAAACDAQRISFEQPVDVALPGGILEITVGRDRNVRMKGPARRVFLGEVMAG